MTRSGFFALPTQPGYVSVTTKVILDGNFFKRDPGKTFRGNVRDMLDKLAEWMEAEVKSEIAGHAGSMPGYSGWSYQHTKGITGWDKRWGTWAAVQAYTKDLDKKDAIRTKAAAASIEKRFHPYRRVRSGVYRSRPIIQASLAKGLE